MVTQLFIKYFTRKKALSCVNDSVRLIQSFSTEVTPLDHQGNNKQAGHCTVRELDPTSVAGRSQSEVDSIPTNSISFDKYPWSQGRTINKTFKPFNII